MKLTFLGTGTSIGVPAIGCRCNVCVSSDPHNKRRRASLYVQACGQHVVVDTPPDFREQVLTFSVPRLDAALFTHGHIDHVAGFDDIRRFNQVQKEIIPIYGSADTLADLSRIFPYIHRQAKPGLSFPRVRFNAVVEQFRVGEILISPIPVCHADIPTYGYRFEADGFSAAYIPDCQALDQKALDLLQGLDVIVLDTLRLRPHPTHFCLAESTAILRKLKAGRAYLTHLSHEIDHSVINAGLPANIRLAYDGLAISL